MVGVYQSGWWWTVSHSGVFLGAIFWEGRGGSNSEESEDCGGVGSDWPKLTVLDERVYRPNLSS